MRCCVHCVRLRRNDLGVVIDLSTHRSCLINILQLPIFLGSAGPVFDPLQHLWLTMPFSGSLTGTPSTARMPATPPAVDLVTASARGPRPQQPLPFEPGYCRQTKGERERDRETETENERETIKGERDVS